MLSTEVQERITDAMGSLSQMERAAFVLRHFEGHSIDEISQSLGLKTNADEAQHLPRGAQDARGARTVRRDDGLRTASRERRREVTENREPRTRL